MKLNMDRDLLAALNPALEGNRGIILNPGTRQDLIIPFGLQRERFRLFTWNNIEQYPVYFQVTSTLTTKEIYIAP